MKDGRKLSPTPKMPLKSSQSGAEVGMSVLHSEECSVRTAWPPGGCQPWHERLDRRVSCPLFPRELEPAKGMRRHTRVRAVTVPKKSQPGPAEGFQPS